MWANAKNNVTGRPGEPPDNLLLVKPYHWKPFIGYADVNNASGNDLSTTDDSQRLANEKINDKEDDVQLVSDVVFIDLSFSTMFIDSLWFHMFIHSSGPLMYYVGFTSATTQLLYLKRKERGQLFLVCCN